MSDEQEIARFESMEGVDHEAHNSDTSSTPNIIDLNFGIFQIPPLEQDVVIAKQYLHKVRDQTGNISLYDHISELLAKLLKERPENAVEFFEEYSREIKDLRFHPDKDVLRDVCMPSDAYGAAVRLMPVFEVTPESVEEGGGDRGDEVPSRVSNVMENFYFLAQVGIGLPQQEIFLIFLALRKLSQDRTIEHLRFWGKIFGTKRNYYVAEAQMTEDEYAKRNAEIDEEKILQAEEMSQVDEAAVFTQDTEILDLDEKVGLSEYEEKVLQLLSKVPPVPRSTFKPPLEVPPEIPGTGTNKMVYYVCNSLDESWVMLPDVTPQQINFARKIKKFFVGDLSTKVQISPAFPGTEMNYLRAQIARISAGTQVSPRGFYRTGQDEEEEEEIDEERLAQDIVENPDYEPLSITVLLDIDNWVHHTSHILEQGRVVWWKSPVDGQVEEEEEGEEDQEGIEDMLAKEVGPPLLNPLSEDVTLETVPPWNIRTSSHLAPETAVVIVMSNLWPGAYCFVAGRKTDNVYLGFGNKFTSTNFTPETMEPIQQLYLDGPEIMEMDDPTPEEEEAWRLEHAPKEEEEEETEEDTFADEEDED